jgi:hypothetical protein
MIWVEIKAPMAIWWDLYEEKIDLITWLPEPLFKQIRYTKDSFVEFFNIDRYGIELKGFLHAKKIDRVSLWAAFKDPDQAILFKLSLP